MPKVDRKLMIKQYLESQIFLLNGSNNKSYEGSYSENFYNINRLYSVNTETRKNQFLTSISYSEEDNISISKYKDIINVIENNQKYEVKLKTFDRPLSSSSNVECFKIKNDFYIFKCEYNYEIIEPEYAWYIYKNDQKVDQVWYTESNILKYQFTEPGIYRIQYFIRD